MWRNKSFMCIAIWYDISISRNSKQFLLAVTQSYFSKILFFFLFIISFSKILKYSAGICLLYSLDRNIIFLTNTVFRHWRSQGVLREIQRGWDCTTYFVSLAKSISHFYIFNQSSIMPSRRTSPLFIYPPRTTSSIHLIFPIDKKFLVNRPQINLLERINVGNLGSTPYTTPFSCVWLEEFSKEIPRKTIYVFSSCHWNLAEHIHSSSLLILTLHD